MISFLSAGVILGLSAGLSPGPLLALIISQTIKHGTREGAKVAIAPLITDFPIIILSTFVLARLSGYQSILGLVSITGGLFLSYLSYESIRTVGFKATIVEAEPQSLSRGAIVNALSPHPYLFWITVGAPTILKGWTESPLLAVAFVASFFWCLVGSKVVLAVLAGKSRRFLIGKSYIYIMRILGLALFAFALVLFRDGLSLLK